MSENIIKFLLIVLLMFSPLILIWLHTILIINPQIWYYSWKSVDRTWDKKSDESILAGYNDSNNWISLSEGSLKSETLDNIADNCRERLDNRILPQMRKRGLTPPD